MKFLAIGDPHFKVNNSSLTDEFHKKTIEFLSTQKDLAFIVVLGDVLDRHETIHQNPLKRATKFLEDLSLYTKKVFVLIGNHDRINNKVFLTDEHPFPGYSTSEKIIIVWKPHYEVIENKKFVFVPYVSTGLFALGIHNLPKGIYPFEADCIFAHQEFKGVNMGVTVSTKGDNWSLKYPLVISGHIHERQQLQKNILYVGTPYQTSFAESPDKSISLFSFGDLLTENSEGESNLLELSENLFEKRIFLDLPKKKTVNITFEEFDDYKPPKDQHKYKILITGTPSQIQSIKKDKKIFRWIKSGHKINYTYKDEIVSQRVGVDENYFHHKSYQETLRLAVTSNEKLKKAFEEVFN